MSFSLKKRTTDKMQVNRQGNGKQIEKNLIGNILNWLFLLFTNLYSVSVERLCKEIFKLLSILRCYSMLRDVFVLFLLRCKVERVYYYPFSCIVGVVVVVVVYLLR